MVLHWPIVRPYLTKQFMFYLLEIACCLSFITYLAALVISWMSTVLSNISATIKLRAALKFEKINIKYPYFMAIDEFLFSLCDLHEHVGNAVHGLPGPVGLADQPLNAAWVRLGLVHDPVVHRSHDAALHDGGLTQTPIN